MKVLFVDIGGVLLTNGWDRQARQRAAETFHLDYQEMEERHRLIFEMYEVGKISLMEYLRFVVFYQPRSFTPDEMANFMYSQSKPYQETLDLVASLKAQYGIKIVAVSNEGRELAEYRIQTYQLGKIIDFFIISGFVQLRKPDAAIFRLALDTAQVKPHETLYLEDRQLFVEVAADLGIQAIRHQTAASSRKEIETRLRG